MSYSKFIFSCVRLREYRQQTPMQDLESLVKYKILNDLKGSGIDSAGNNEASTQAMDSQARMAIGKVWNQAKVFEKTIVQKGLRRKARSMSWQQDQEHGEMLDDETLRYYEELAENTGKWGSIHTQGRQIDAGVAHQGGAANHRSGKTDTDRGCRHLKQRQTKVKGENTQRNKQNEKINKKLT